MNKQNQSRSIFNWNNHLELYGLLLPSDISKFNSHRHFICSMNRGQNLKSYMRLISSMMFLSQSLTLWNFNKMLYKLSIVGFTSINIWNIRNENDYNLPKNIQKIQYVNMKCSVNFITINLNDLINDPDFKAIYLKTDEGERINSSYILDNYLYFNNISYLEMSINFRKNGIIITGGSDTKRHILSITDYRLSQLISTQYGYNLDSVYKSFHLPSMENTINISALTNNSEKENELILKSNQSNFNATIGKDEHPFLDLYKTQERQKNINKINNFNNDLMSVSTDQLIEIIERIGNIIQDVKGESSNNNINNEDNNSINQENNNSINQEELNNSSAGNNTSINQEEELTKNNNGKTNQTNGSYFSKRSYHTSSRSEDLQNKNNIYSYLDKISKLVEESKNDDNLIKIQSQIEEGWIDDVKNHMISEHSNKNFLISQIKLAYTSWIIFMNNKKNYSKLNKLIKSPEIIDYLKNMDILIIAFSLSITYYRIWSYTNLCIQIGNKILYRYYFKSEYGKNSYNTFIENNGFTTETFITLGDYILSMFITRDIFERKYSTDQTETSYLVINAQTVKEIVKNLIIHPSSLPMICKPLEWSESQYGGFILNSHEKTDLIGGNYNKHNHLVKNKDALFSAVNNLNNIKFKINDKLLRYLLNEGSYLLNDSPPTNKLEMESYLSNELQKKITLKIAQVYNKIAFYLNVHSDWRGRLYTNSFWITYQGNDLSSALLNFYDGQVLTEKGLEYLYIYGANLYNYKKISKKPIQTRINWVLDNKDRILRMDPIFIGKAEEKFLFTSFCLVMRDLEKDPQAIVNLPIFLDATCSGIQHLAALIQDYELGSRVNLISQKSEDSVGDIYADLVNPINNAINQLGNTDIKFTSLRDLKFDRSILKLSIMTKVYNVTNFGIAHQLESKLEKIDVKMKSDSGKFYTKENYLIPNKDGGTNIINRDHLFIIAKIINEQIFIAFPRLKEIYSYFIDVAKILAKLGLHVAWFTPSGLEIHQKYLKMEKRKISISLGGKNKVLTYNIFNKNQLDKGKQNSAIIPNIIHSLDASHLINIINSAKSENFGDVISVHDCFGALPNNMWELEQRVRKEFIKIYYDNSFLKKFHQNFLNTITINNYEIVEIGPLDDLRTIWDTNNKVVEIIPRGESCKVVVNYEYLKTKTKIYRYKLPVLPEIGTLDINEIINSKYMIT